VTRVIVRGSDTWSLYSMRTIKLVVNRYAHELVLPVAFFVLLLVMTFIQQA
jgi:hypothetical protein